MNLAADMAAAFDLVRYAGLREAVFDAAPVTLLRHALHLIAFGHPVADVVTHLNTDPDLGEAWLRQERRALATRQRREAAQVHGQAARALTAAAKAAAHTARIGPDQLIAELAALVLTEQDPTKLRHCFAGVLRLYAALHQRPDADLPRSLASLSEAEQKHAFHTSLAILQWCKTSVPPETLAAWQR